MIAMTARTAMDRSTLHKRRITKFVIVTQTRTQSKPILTKKNEARHVRNMRDLSRKKKHDPSRCPLSAIKCNEHSSATVWR